MSENVFYILGIEPTNDKKEIKKAYAGLVKRYHPEEFPEEWKKIHDAYEQALKMAEHAQTPIPAQLPEPSVKMEAPEPPEPSAKIEMPEPPVQEKSEEMESLFDNIGEMAREQHHQDAETFKLKLQEVMDDFRKISGKNEIDIKEWEAFFHQEAKLPYICTREFLAMLGDCFENRTIEVEMYRFLKEQLAIITQYAQDRNIELQNIGLLNPADYAEKKIYKAYAGESAARSLDDAGTRKREIRKRVWFILIIVGILIRSATRYARNTQERPEVPPISMIENATAQNITEEMQRISEQQEKIKEELSQSVETIEVGDTRAKMISLYGEPDSWQKEVDMPYYEEAVYHLYGVDMIITLYTDIVTNVRYETNGEEEKGE